MWRVYVAVVITVAVMMILSLLLGGPITDLLNHWQGK